MTKQNCIKAVMSLFVVLFFVFGQANAVFFLKKNTTVGSVRSGGIDGGGGLVLACTTNGKTQYELLDTYQARIDFNLQVSLPPGRDYTEKLFATIERFKKVAPLRAEIYKSWATQFLSQQIEWKRNTQLPQSLDEGKASILLPKGDCKIVQVAYQRTDQQRAYPGQEKLVIIDADIFEKLSDTDKAALLLHEIIYFEARAYWKHTNSKYVRYFNALILSDAMKTEKQYDEVIRSMNERSKDVDHGGYKKAYDDFREWIPRELRFSSGMHCLDVIGSDAICNQTAKVADTFKYKDSSIEFEIRNFKNYINKSKVKAFSPTKMRDDEDRAARLFLNGQNFNVADLTFKLNGKIVQIQNTSRINFTIVDRLSEDVKQGSPLTLVIGTMYPEEGKAINMSMDGLQVIGAETFNTNFMFDGPYGFTLKTSAESEVITNLFYRGGSYFIYDDPRLYRVTSAGKFEKTDRITSGMTSSEENRRYGYGASL